MLTPYNLICPLYNEGRNFLSRSIATLACLIKVFKLFKADVGEINMGDSQKADITRVLQRARAFHRSRRPPDKNAYHV